MGDVTIQVVSKPTGLVKVTIMGEADYPDALDDMTNRARDLHHEVLLDCVKAWGVETVEPEAEADDDD